MQNYFLKLSPPAIAYFSLLLFFGKPDQTAAVLLAVGVHEVSHLLSLAFFNCSVSSVNVGLNGLCINYSGKDRPVEAFVSSTAGPVGGFLFYLLGKLLPDHALPLWFIMSSRISLFLSLFNSLPAYPLDGGYALNILLTPVLENGVRERIIRAAGLCFSCLLILSGLAFLMKNGGFGASAAGIWLLCANISADDL